MSALERLGWLLNIKKSRLQPMRVQQFLGLILDYEKQECRLPPEKLVRLHYHVLNASNNPTMSLRRAMSLLGSLSSCIPAVQWAQFQSRTLQGEVLAHQRVLGGYLEGQLTLSRNTRESLEWWLDKDNLSRGVPWEYDIFRIITTDASPSGWGAHMSEILVQGLWEHHQIEMSSNLKELTAVEQAAKRLLVYLQGHHVRVFSDNQVTVAYINHQGGTRSKPLMNVAERLFQLAERHFLSLTALHIKGKENITADFLSRNLLRQGEWSLKTSIFDLIVQKWGQPERDLFATMENRKVRQFCSLNPRENPLAVDAFLIKWDFRLAYAFPPLSLLPLVLRKIRRDRARVIVIFPFWPRRAWFSSLRTMSVSEPWVLPDIPDLLSQGPVFHPQVAGLHLTAWSLSGHC
ncbi:uncharacterized protein [Dendrobates tinctorius]|uniref:uncharacterized protein n=1 Tax=Dendrobates tinctorius TaxID=92724 RepID=UPI003CC9755D